MIEHKPIFQQVSPPVQRFEGPLRTIAELDRVVLADVKKEWNESQSKRDRNAIYGYLHIVFMQVDWWQQKPNEMREAVQTIKLETPNIELPDDMYAAVIACTANPKKVDDKTRSKWSRVLRYAAKYKPEKELLRDFLQRKGGIDKCASRYTRRLRRRSNGAGKKAGDEGR
jgi:hypothetical protein